MVHHQFMVHHQEMSSMYGAMMQMMLICTRFKHIRVSLKKTVVAAAAINVSPASAGAVQLVLSSA